MNRAQAVTWGEIALSTLLAFACVAMLFAPTIPLALSFTVMAVAGLGLLYLLALARIDARKHRHTHIVFAEKHPGWRYSGGSVDFLGRFSSFPFRTGYRPRQIDVLTGSYSGMQCATFTQVFETKREDELGDSLLYTRRIPWVSRRNITRYFQVTVVEVPVRMPLMHLVKENAAQSIRKLLGGSDLDIESDDFNRTWRVVHTDAPYAHAVLNPRLAEALLRNDPGDASITLEGGAMYMWQVGRRPVSQLSSRLNTLTAMARYLPSHVVLQQERAGLGRDGEGVLIEQGPEWATKGGVLNAGSPTGLDLNGFYRPQQTAASGDASVPVRNNAPLSSFPWDERRF